ncbi:hypothetical protein P168DRAFT_86729 [Aspergillus campestris IBT 28561]|uniref:Uncharacterized protein n=1 Tax=Aspergillus campestris (strain IBT 28561) TaxID=1392248 RepID=A0A2I1DAZ9_ASPC2|nr:uncharacterized protein P168DRAFT_86729 [Aspergillus campestris IBT 28561]PKY07048.1 hypothetical protein P168DRAFT_86729 [Aspergillus campestris IBT 28561]
MPASNRHGRLGTDLIHYAPIYLSKLAGLYHFLLVLSTSILPRFLSSFLPSLLGLPLVTYLTVLDFTYFTLPPSVFLPFLVSVDVIILIYNCDFPTARSVLIHLFTYQQLNIYPIQSLVVIRGVVFV